MNKSSYLLGVQKGLNLRYWLPCGLFLGLLVSSGAIWGNEGVFLPGLDAQEMGRAGSGVASPRSAYWLYLNPASTVDLESRVDANLYTVFPHIELKPRGPLGNSLDGKLESDGCFPIPAFGAIWNLGEYGVLGGGTLVPSGTGVEYPHSRNIISRLFQGDEDRKLTYQHYRLVLSYAYQLPCGWALGANLQGSFSRFKSDHMTLGFHPADADDEFDTDFGAGFGVGLYKAWERVSVGLSYNSQQWCQKFSKYNDLFANPADLPQTVQAGVAFRVTQAIELTADFKYLNWESIPTYGNSMFKGGFNWRDQLGGKVGAEWKATDHWTFRCGYSNLNSPISEDHVFLSAMVPVVVEQHVTVGATYIVNEHSEVHFAFVQGIRNTLRDSGHGKGDLFSWLGKDSELSASGESFALGYTYKFGKKASKEEKQEKPQEQTDDKTPKTT